VGAGVGTDEGTGLGEGTAVGTVVGTAVGDGVILLSDMTETVPEPALATNISPLAES
jgi:hypothetical protein